MLFSIDQFLVFFIILARIVGFFVIAPVFSDRTIPQMMKLIFALWLTITLWFSIDIPKDIPENTFIIIGVLANEFLIGLLIGFIARIMFVGIQTAGSLMDMQMGLSAAAAFDPSTGAQATLMSRIVFYFALLIFVVTDGHHLLLIAFRQSFKVIPVIRVVEYSNVLEMLGTLGAKMFAIAATLALPIMVIIFLLDFSLGLLSRLAPQVNVFFLGFQIKPVLGIWVFMLLTPTITSEIKVLLYGIANHILHFYQLVRVVN